MKKTLFIFLITLFTSFSYGQRFHETIANLYGGFIPHESSDDAYNKKMKQLDSLWILVKSDTVMYINELRKELQKNDNPSFFYYDGGALLTSVSNSNSDKIIAIKALEKTDILDVDSDIYFHMVQSSSLNQIDITNLAIKILDKEQFQAYIVEHAFTIDKDYCLYYLLIPQDPLIYVPKLIERYKLENKIENKTVIINMLWHSCSCLANDFMKEILRNPKTEKECKQLLKDLGFISNSTTKPRGKKYNKLIKKRKDTYSIITDYTIQEIKTLTKKLRKYNCL